jgi:hypothetical protein
MATTKRSSGGTRKSSATRSRAASTSKAAPRTRTTKARSNGSAAASKAAKAKTARAGAGTASRNGANRTQSGTTAKRATASRNGSAHRNGSTRPRATATQPNGTVETLKRKGSAMLQAADRAGGPALTVAAAAAGLAGGLALRQRPRIVDPGIVARSRNVLRDVDPSAVIEGLGKATVELGKRSKVIARELDHVADRAERFGKILS